jgi:hypothetical protein
MFMDKCPDQFVNIFAAGFMENKLATSFFFLEASIVIICNQGVVLDSCTDTRPFIPAYVIKWQPG